MPAEYLRHGLLQFRHAMVDLTPWWTLLLHLRGGGRPTAQLLRANTILHKKHSWKVTWANSLLRNNIQLQSRYIPLQAFSTTIPGSAFVELPLAAPSFEKELQLRS